MTDLKTLNDIFEGQIFKTDNPSMPFFAKRKKFATYDEIRDEAKKWIKHWYSILDDDRKKGFDFLTTEERNIYHQKIFLFKHFFNVDDDGELEIKYD